MFRRGGLKISPSVQHTITAVTFCVGTADKHMAHAPSTDVDFCKVARPPEVIRCVAHTSLIHLRPMQGRALAA